MHPSSPDSSIDQQNILSAPNLAEKAIEERPHAGSRRSFLGRGLAVAAAPAAVLATSRPASAAPGYDGVFPTYYPGSTRKNFQEIQVDEFEHVYILTELIKSLGGTPRPNPTFVGIQNLSPGTFLSYADAFENTGVAAYLGAAAYIQSPTVLTYAVQIALVEAYHSGFLNTLLGATLIPNAAPLVYPKTIPQIVGAITPFIGSLNDGGAFPATFSTTPSPQNDIAILNFALLLEILEAEFYYYNVPALFPS